MRRYSGYRTTCSVRNYASGIRVKQGAAVTEEEVRGFCQGRIAHFKIPRYIRFVDEFPMTVTGKVQKFVIRQRMIEALGLTLQKTA